MSSTNRTGRVSSIDYEAGTYEVTYYDRGQSVTKKINAISNGEYKMPSIGQTVSVSHQSNGTAQATTTGTIWNETNQPAEGYEGLYRKEYSNSKGQAYEKYDANTGVYTQYSDKRTGRQCNGEIFDEAVGAISTVAGGQIQIQSTGSSVGIQASTGFGVVAGTTASIEAGTSLSMEAGGDMSQVSGGEYTLEIADTATETYKGKVSREYKSTITEKVTGKVSREYGAAVTEKVTGAANRECESTATEKFTGAVSREYESTLTEEITGKVERTLSEGIEGTITGDVTLTINGATITIDTGGNISITSPAKIDITAPEINITGDSGDVTINGISLTTHTHADEGSGVPN